MSTQRTPVSGTTGSQVLPPNNNEDSGEAFVNMGPASPGKVLEAIASKGSVANSIHSPIPVRGGISQINRSQTKDAATANATTNKDNVESVDVVTYSIGEENTTQAGQETTVLPRRSGRKTSAPTIIRKCSLCLGTTTHSQYKAEPITSQTISKPKHGKQPIGMKGPLPTTSTKTKETDNSTVDPSATATAGTTNGGGFEVEKSKGPKNKRPKGTKLVLFPLALQAQSRSYIAFSPPLDPYLAAAGPPSEQEVVQVAPFITEDDDEDEEDMVDETEALQILAAQKESLRRPISPFDAAHSSDKERRHIARAETISKATSHPLPLGARPDPTRPSRINEPGSPPPAKKLKDNNYLSTISFVRTSTSRPRKTPTPAHSPPPHAPRSQHSPREEEEEEVSNPWGTVNG
ncbi:hypothetical protein EV361DRAFT_874550 [Lentinula raphanica]|nr:hypothetical protein EV361DRAFT_874550 [Lentinula raphanica]